MTQYLLSLHSGPATDEPTAPMSADQMQTYITQIYALQDEMKAAGAWVFGGRLTPPDTATVVRATPGDVLISDGPYVESKEHLGGFYIVAAADLDEALSWATKTSRLVGMPIEVRPLWDEG